jgi:hypothetical protein
MLLMSDNCIEIVEVVVVVVVVVLSVVIVIFIVVKVVKFVVHQIVLHHPEGATTEEEGNIASVP